MSTNALLCGWASWHTCSGDCRGGAWLRTGSADPQDESDLLTPEKQSRCLPKLSIAIHQTQKDTAAQTPTEMAVSSRPHRTPMLVHPSSSESSKILPLLRSAILECPRMSRPTKAPVRTAAEVHLHPSLRLLLTPPPTRLVGVHK